MTTEYRIEFQIQRRQDTDDDFVEIGFGSSAGWEGVSDALYELQSIVDNQGWETEPGQPDPDDPNIRMR